MQVKRMLRILVVGFIVGVAFTVLHQHEQPPPPAYVVVECSVECPCDLQTKAVQLNAQWADQILTINKSLEWSSNREWGDAVRTLLESSLRDKFGDHTHFVYIRACTFLTSQVLFSDLYEGPHYLPRWRAAMVSSTGMYHALVMVDLAKPFRSTAQLSPERKRQMGGTLRQLGVRTASADVSVVEINNEVGEVGITSLLPKYVFPDVVPLTGKVLRVMLAADDAGDAGHSEESVWCAPKRLRKRGACVFLAHVMFLASWSNMATKQIKASKSPRYSIWRTLKCSLDPRAPGPAAVRLPFQLNMSLLQNNWIPGCIHIIDEAVGLFSHGLQLGKTPTHIVRFVGEVNKSIPAAATHKHVSNLIRPLLIEPPVPVTGPKPRLMIIAHPDDDVLWAGDVLLTYKPWHIVCVTCENPKRAISERWRPKVKARTQEFVRLLRVVGATGVGLGFEDYRQGGSSLDKPDALARVMLKHYFSKGAASSWDAVVVQHASSGPYRPPYRHPQHINVYNNIVSLWCKSGRAFKLYTWAYRPIQDPRVRMAKLRLSAHYPSQAHAIGDILSWGTSEIGGIAEVNETCSDAVV